VARRDKKEEREKRTAQNFQREISRFLAEEETSHDTSLKKARKSVYQSRLLGNDLFHQERNSMVRERCA